MSEIDLSRSLSAKSLDFADSILAFVENGLDGENKVLDLYDDIDASLKFSIGPIACAHLRSFVWTVMSDVRFSHMNLDTEEAVKTLNRNITAATRLTLAEFYEGGRDA